MRNYNFEGKKYEITITDEGDRNEQREEQIVIDFKYLESKGDWLTIKNRITNGLLWGWMVCKGDSDSHNNNREFW